MSQAAEREPKVGLFDLALAEEIRAEMARQRMQDKEMYAKAGIPSTTFARYWKTPETSAPIAKIRAVAEALGLSAAELVARAEANLERQAARDAGHDAPGVD